MFYRRRVVVTGVGIVSPLGIGAKTSWEALLTGQSGLRALTDESIVGSEATGPLALLPSRVAGTVQGFDPKLHTSAGGDARNMGRFTHFALAAASDALQNAGILSREKSKDQVKSSSHKKNDHENIRGALELAGYDSHRAGVAIGSGIGSVSDLTAAATLLDKRGPAKLSPYFVPKVLLNMPAGQVALHYGLRGPQLAHSTACATGAHAIGEAFRSIALACDADVMLAGATEASIDRLSMAGFTRMRALSTAFNDDPTAASRPFDSARDGFVMGEGAAVLLLEELTFALKRGAPILAELRGYGVSGDAHHITAPAPDGSGALRAMKSGLASCWPPVQTQDVQYINAHATSTPLGDDIEGMAIDKFFEGTCMSGSELPLVSSTKGATGHLLGAAGALEAAFTVLTVAGSGSPFGDQSPLAVPFRVPATRNLQKPSSDFSNWRHVGNAVATSDSCSGVFSDSSRTATPPKAAISNSFGFGGTNASLLFCQPSLNVNGDMEGSTDAA